MKPSTILAYAAAALTIATVFSSGPASAADAECGRIRIRCRDNYKLTCTEGEWQCIVEGKAATSTCISVCPDGHEYPTCDPNGHELFIPGDPCERHSSFTEESNSCKGPTTMTCKKGTILTCEKDIWTCAAPTSVTAEGKVVITGVNPEKVQTGKYVSISGKGFSPRNNVIIFADSVIPNIGSTNGKHLSFRIPSHTVRPCYLTKEAPCTAPTRTYKAGTYAISIKAGNEISNVMTIRISGR